MLKSQADAEDAVQHTFIAAHADIQRHGERQLHVKAWLYTIARNRCLSMLRARREQVADDELELATDNLSDEVQQREELRLLLADVQRLPDDQREALVLAEVGDLAHTDIAEVLGCEANKVKSLVFQARTSLIDRRTARETPCAEIREQIATLRGGALRRSHLRHHLEACPGCSEYREEVRRQRAMLAVALPVMPSAALKANVLGGLGLGGSAAAGGTGAAAASAAATGSAGGIGALASGGLAKLGIAAALAAGGVGTAAVAENGGLPLLQGSQAGQGSNGGGAGGAGGAGTTTTTSTSTERTGTHKTGGSRRSESGTEHGFTPTTGESNGERAREFAKTRGKKKGLAKRHLTAHSKRRAKRVRAKRMRPATKQKARTPTVKEPAAQTVPRTPTTPSKTPPASTTPAATTTTTTTTTPTQTQPAPPVDPGNGGKGLGSAGKRVASVTD